MTILRTKRTISGAALLLAGTLGLAQAALANPDEHSKVKKTSTTRTTTETSDEGKAADSDTAVQPDNTKRNVRDRNDGEVTADSQKNNKSDMEVAREIRRAVVKDKSLSVYAHNVKIVAEAGTVTLKGPVHSAEEKASIEKKAAATVGQANVKNELEVKP